MRRFHYRLYGVLIESADPFPGLTPVSPEGVSEEGIVIEGRRELPLRRVRGNWTSFYGLDYWFSPDRRFALIQSREVGVFRVDFQKKKIEWGAASKISSTYAHAILRVRIVGFLVSHLVPFLLLHASVVVEGKKGVAFGGVIASGKSTLTASCLNNGFSLLSDDIAALQRENGHFLLHPGAPEFRLWPWTASRLNPHQVKGERVAPEVKKKKFLLGPETPWRFEDKPVPLRRLYLLSRKKGAKVRIESLHGREALIGVLQNIYNPILGHRDVLRRQLEMAADLVQRVPVKRLVYPSGFSRLARVRRAITEDLRKQ